MINSLLDTANLAVGETWEVEVKTISYTNSSFLSHVNDPSRSLKQDNELD
jgi:hypothetical protein